jgi:hypothetical protein
MSKAFVRESDDEPPEFKKRPPAPKAPALWEIGGPVLRRPTVTVRSADGETTRYRLVGAEEIDAEKHWVNRASPIGRALADARVGEKVRFQTPAGQAELEVIAVGTE